MKQTWIKRRFVLVIGLFTCHITSSCVNKSQKSAMNNGIFPFCCVPKADSNESDSIPLINNNSISNNHNNSQDTITINSSNGSEEEIVHFDYKEFSNTLDDNPYLNKHMRKRNK